MQLSELEQQISEKLELINQMNSLLVQRAARINELETLLGSCDHNKQVSCIACSNRLLCCTGETIRL